MTKLKQIKEALEASLHALRCVRDLVNAAGNRNLIRLVDEGIAACKDAPHDPRTRTRINERLARRAIDPRRRIHRRLEG
jgi:hypothetical protein